MHESMSHVTYEWIMSHMNESCHAWMSHATYQWVMIQISESCNIWMSHATYEWVEAHKCSPSFCVMCIAFVQCLFLLSYLTLKEEAGRALMSTSNQSSTPVKWHSTHNKGGPTYMHESHHTHVWVMPHTYFVQCHLMLCVNTYKQEHFECIYTEHQITVTHCNTLQHAVTHCNTSRDWQVIFTTRPIYYIYKQEHFETTPPKLHLRKHLRDTYAHTHTLPPPAHIHI